MRWQDGYPCDSGSVDCADSARLAGIMQVFNHPERNWFDIYNYFGDDGYLRHPIYGNWFNGNYIPFSRDQASCLFAGLYIKDSEYSFLSVDQDFQPKNDIIMPSVRGHFKRCAGLKANWFQDLWLWLDVLYSCFIDPLAEPNQLATMLYVHPNKKYLLFWKKHNKYWKKAFRNYWYENDGSWRAEKDLCEHIISKIDKD